MGSLTHARTTILRHCVDADEDGLSYMQRNLIDSQALITIASAPTGAGKSFVFRKALAQGERILFIVPTRRLGQNQCNSMRDDMCDPAVAEREGFEVWERQLAEAKIQRWDSNFSEFINQRGWERSSQYYAKHLGGLSHERGGEIIFTTPELMSHLFFSIRKDGGRGDITPDYVISQFDRIVFDEFHLIKERGFGFLATLAGVAKCYRDTQAGEGAVEGNYARIVLLSATPVDISSVLMRLGFDVERDVQVIEERLVDDGPRALHGDVDINFVNCANIPQLIAELEVSEGILSSISTTNKMVVIYDSLRALKEDKWRLYDLFQKHGVPKNEILFDNSQDAQHRSDITGGHHELSDKSVIVSTSTLEVGVTISHTTYLITNPGHTSLNLMQRVGRVARGDYEGTAWIIYDDKGYERRPWLRKMIEAVAATDGSMTIGEFTAIASHVAGLNDSFDASNLPHKIEEHRVARLFRDSYGQMGKRAIFTSGLYWCLLLESLQKCGHVHARNRFLQMQPKVAKTIFGWLKIIRELHSGGDEWVEAFMQEGKDLRGFTPEIIVRCADTGEQIKISEEWLALNTVILQSFALQYGEDGSFYVEIPTYADLEECIRDSGDFGTYKRYMLGPTLDTISRPNRFVSESAHYLSVLEAPSTRLGFGERGDKLKQAMSNLIRTTGLVPYADGEHGSSEASVSAVI